ncbi:MAG: hypothetical protein QOE28_1528 [Solirubrobacteraceae bacterium]|nr:hypothetical protein [Solirubrobacteraceae bacterium]
MARACRAAVRIVCWSALLLAAGCGGSAHPAGQRVTAPDRSSPQEQGGQYRFVTECGFSHRAPDDPIMAPGHPGMSHSHDFFGNRSTDARSTLATLSRAGTTCQRSADRSGYWVPTLYLHGRAIRPRFVLAYYYGSPDKSPRRVQPPPAGLKIIAGDAGATSPQSTRVVSWDCGPESHITERSEVPQCPQGHSLRMLVRFPDCWDGRHLDSPDHQSHVAYYGTHSCPASHPVQIPKLFLKVSYPILGGPGVTLASGSRYSGHADFFSGWREPAVAELVRRCIQQGPEAPRARPCDKPRPKS